MRAFKAHVTGGRLVLDERTNLPEGAEVRVALVDGDELDDEERARLHEALDAGIAAARAGDHVDADEFIRELLARP
jgi:predicted transcriptional regulator